MAQLLSEVAVGTTVKINENGSPVNWIVVQKGNPNSNLYDASCDGIWVVRKEPIEGRRSYGNSNKYSISNGDSLSRLWVSYFDSNIKSNVKTVKIPYVDGTGENYSIKTGANGYSTTGFLLAAREIGISSYFGGDTIVDGALLTYFSSPSNRIAYVNGDEAVSWWTRTPANGSAIAVIIMQFNGTASNNAADSGLNWVRPACILRSDALIVNDSGAIETLNSPTFTTLPVAIMQGQSLDVGWEAVINADSYVLERKVDSGEWTQIYSGANLSYTDTIGEWSTVQYRVKAGLSTAYSDYTTSNAISVINPSSLVISGTDSDLGTLTGPVTYSVSSDTGNAISVTETVNGVALRTYTTTSGVQQSIAIPDLPTGNGSIVIAASVQASSGAVNQTRSWTYTKTAPTFPSGPFDISTLSKGGKTQFPLTLAEAVKMPFGMRLDDFS